MDFSYILNKSLPDQEKLKAAGFQPEVSGTQDETGSQNGIFPALSLCLPLPETDFYTKITLTQNSLTALVFENETDEPYALVDVPSARGTFVTSLRAKVQEQINKIEKACFTSSDLSDRYKKWLVSTFRVQPDFPWSDKTSYAVYRCPNTKWFALIMQIKFKNLGLKSEEPVWVVNLKADPKKIPEIVDNKSIFPAWHMNKKNWITAALTAVTDFEKLSALTKESFDLVNTCLV